MAAQNTSFKAYLGQLEDFLNLYLVKKAPALPTNVKEFIVKFAPWVTLILLVISLPVLLAVFGLGAFLMPFSFLGGPTLGVSYMLTLVLTAVTIILEALAIPGLMKQKQSAWYLVFYASLVSAVEAVVGLHITSLIGVAVGLYFLFQVRSYYK